MKNKVTFTAIINGNASIPRTFQKSFLLSEVVSIEEYAQDEFGKHEGEKVYVNTATESFVLCCSFQRIDALWTAFVNASDNFATFSLIQN